MWVDNESLARGKPVRKATIISNDDIITTVFSIIGKYQYIYLRQ